jgi:HD-GYP domain-containing protein (c-di-GMP phosphodiesterase class II)
MASTTTLLPPLGLDDQAAAPRDDADGPVERAVASLAEAFGQPFLLVDARAGELLNAEGAALGWDFSSRMPLLAEAARRGEPEIVEHEAPLSMLAIPLAGLDRGGGLVAVSVFLTMQVSREGEIASAARVFGVDAGRALAWAQTADVWTTRALDRLASAALDNIVKSHRLEFLEHEMHEAVAHARDSYAELGLLHRLTSRLTVADDDGQLWRRAVQWLAESIPAQCLAVVPHRGEQTVIVPGLTSPAPQVIHGDCPLPAAELEDLIARIGAGGRRPVLLSRFHTGSITWNHPTVRELACTPIRDGSQIVGWLAALNHNGSATGDVCEFGSAEIRLLESVSTILGVHRNNAGLFHRQADLFGAAVRALISAIDAKDNYTHGHSERVARVSVCLAEALRLSRAEINTIYLGGLLHDIGKIGVEDAVLRKPGALTPEEFAQIKQHPQLGYDILSGVRQLERILPIVLHHHESWDGSGYPHGLAREETPVLARVAAVADAFDAMSSDRPYRRGMPDEKLDAIFREGAGRQWDPTVIDAFFSIRDEVRQAAHDAALGTVPLDALSWVN